MVQSTRPFPPPPPLLWQPDREAEYLMTPPPSMYPSTDECWRIFERQTKERLDEIRLDDRAPNFILVPWSDQEIYESLIRDDKWSAAYFCMAMYVVACLCIPLWVILKEWLGG